MHSFSLAETCGGLEEEWESEAIGFDTVLPHFYIGSDALLSIATKCIASDHGVESECRRFGHFFEQFVGIVEVGCTSQGFDEFGE